MTTIPVTADRARFLRAVLAADALVTGANGLAYLAAAPLIGEFLGPDAGLLRGLGAFLLVYGAAVALLAARREAGPAGTRIVIALNVVWTLGSIAAVVSGALEFTTAGAFWAVAQALVVGVFAELQIVGLRKARH
ncbi:hypothetical protein [Nonomuraea typhae]|uniref:Integral membrane protein n=1 Tax=Nonomuraea typhae TaxID=2603600 RepID=A0ABW7ZBP6_9ACTN